MGIPFPEEYGGGGGDTLAYALAVEELTRVDSSVAITLCAHTSLGTQPIYLFGTEEQKREWLPRLCSGEVLGAFGLTEPEAGSDAGNTRTRARLEDGEWVIDGAKQFITNAGTEISGVVCITAVTNPTHSGNGDKEISNLIVPNGTPGYEQGEPYRKMGWNASDTRPLTFTDCRVPEENLLGPRGQGFKQFLHILDIGRIGVAAMGVGLAQGALDQALSYARERKAFGKPISKFQAIQAKLADMATEIEAARLLVYKAAREKDAGRNFTLTAAQAKLKTGPPRRALRRGGGADPRRLRLHRGVPGVPLLPRREDPHDRRGHRRGPADGDRPRAGRVDGLMGERLAGKVALVAGGGQTAGREDRQRPRDRDPVRARGGAGGLMDRDGAAATATVETIEAEGGAAAAIEGDVTREEDCAAAVAACVERLGALDVLHHNVGIGLGDGWTEWIDFAAWERIVRVNAGGAMLMAKAALPVMRERGGGAITFVSSIAALVAGAAPMTQPAPRLQDVEGRSGCADAVPRPVLRRARDSRQRDPPRADRHADGRRRGRSEHRHRARALRARGATKPCR